MTSANGGFTKHDLQRGRQDDVRHGCRQQGRRSLRGEGLRLAASLIAAALLKAAFERVLPAIVRRTIPAARRRRKCRREDSDPGRARGRIAIHAGTSRPEFACVEFSLGESKFDLYTIGLPDNLAHPPLRFG